ncbi:PP2C family protein-serine/threonine phosphatase [Nocardioides speluncae]|uniref:PP2C family protein-serine/threonine phosphatase n=1 Tax=Nocardioides speluncae TaxID=2670337 RepID=UPI000D68858D|nr:PP2C family protein-serine/threonine phosphatase [Nocardioides speluncae]
MRRFRLLWLTLRRRGGADEPATMVWLVVLTLVVAVVVSVEPELWPPSLFVIPLVVGSLLLGPSRLPWFVVFVLAMLAATLPFQETLMSGSVVISVAVQFVVGFIIMLTSFRRTRLGVAGARGESMLIDLRDRILSQGSLPRLSGEWQAEWELKSAGGTLFAGDFVVAARTDDGKRLDVAVVDVSGKGEMAGTRALLLSGALSGLLSAQQPQEFLPAANEYLIRQDWDEGFATAVHLSLDLDTGQFELRTAGHPPAVQLLSGSGRWLVHETEGPLLGLIEGAEFVPIYGIVRSGDAVLLYTDGLVETPSRDITLGIDKLLGLGERLLRGGGFHQGAAKKLVAQLGSTNDDCALLLIHRH